MVEQKIVFHQGRYIPVGEAFLRSLIPGQKDRPGVFETFRAYARKLFAFDAHMDRMERGLKVYGHRHVIPRQKIRAIVDELLQKNNAWDARVRVSMVLTDGKIFPTVVTGPLALNLSQKRDAGYHVTLSGGARPASRLSNVKSLEYHLFLKAYERAVDKGFDEALLLDHRQQLVEGARSNFFCAREGVLYTPPVSSGCLNGITRQIVIRLAKRLRIPLRIRPLFPEVLCSSSEAFLTNAIMEIMPLRSVNRQKFFRINQRKIMPVLLKEYQRVVCSA